MRPDSRATVLTGLRCKLEAAGRLRIVLVLWVFAVQWARAGSAIAIGVKPRRCMAIVAALSLSKRRRNRKQSRCDTRRHTGVAMVLASSGVIGEGAIATRRRGRIGQSVEGFEPKFGWPGCGECI